MTLTAQEKTAQIQIRIPKTGEFWASGELRVRITAADEVRTEFDNPSRVGPLSKCNTEWFIRHFHPVSPIPSKD